MKSLGSFSGVLLAFVLLLVFVITPGTSRATEKDFEDFDQTKFAQPTAIDNEWFPLKPGTRFVWEGSAVDDEGAEEPHSVVFTVTDLTKVIGGVRTVVCWDQDFVDGELEETEIVFFAQDDDGAVWHFGQYPEEYEDGRLLATPGWLHGIRDGKAGIYMPADPKLGDPSFSQGWAPSVPWTDRAVVHSTGEKVNVPFGDFADVLVFDETSKDEPDAHALKYYARGVGIVRVGSLGSKGDRESLVLTKVEQLSSEELSKARDQALGLEMRSRENAPGVFAYAQPVELDGKPVAARKVSQVRRISDDQAKEIALRTVPGEVMDVAVERKLGKETIVVEVLTEDGAEVDVIIDMEAGKVLATET